MVYLKDLGVWILHTGTFKHAYLKYLTIRVFLKNFLYLISEWYLLLTKVSLFTFYAQISVNYYNNLVIRHCYNKGFLGSQENYCLTMSDNIVYSQRSWT